MFVCYIHSCTLFLFKYFSSQTSHSVANRIYGCSSEDGEKRDHDKAKDEAPPQPSVEERRAPKKRLGVRKETPEAFMASFLAGLEIYQTKMLVKYLP